MATRVVIKKGDIFKIKDDNHSRYFQFFFQDIDNLTSDLVWIFKLETPTDDLEKILSSGYKFYMYTYTKIGVKMGQFEKIGNAAIPIEMDYIPKFRWTDNDLRYEIKDWYIMQGDKKTYVGKNISNDEKKYPFYSPNFPKMAVETMIRGYDDFM